MEILALVGITLAMALTVGFVLLKLFLALVVVPFKLAYGVAGALLKLTLGLFFVGLAVLVALPLLIVVGVASSLAFAFAILL